MFGSSGHIFEDCVHPDLYPGVQNVSGDQSQSPGHPRRKGRWGAYPLLSYTLPAGRPSARLALPGGPTCQGVQPAWLGLSGTLGTCVKGGGHPHRFSDTPLKGSKVVGRPTSFAWRSMGCRWPDSGCVAMACDHLRGMISSDDGTCCRGPHTICNTRRSPAGRGLGVF